MKIRRIFPLGIAAVSVFGTLAAEEPFPDEIAAVLVEYCYDCHGDGMSKGGVAFDAFESDASLEENREVWAKVLKLLRADIMPPSEKPQPTDEDKATIAQWIKDSVFNIDPENPDPGDVTVRRLNRTEYRNTVRDILGVDFDTSAEFPPDDSGHGFDNIAAVLTVSPMLMEKYLDAAKKIVSEAVPIVSGVPAENAIPGSAFKKEIVAVQAEETEEADEGDRERGERRRRGRDRRRDRDDDTLTLSYYETAKATARYAVEHAGHYQLVLHLRANERYVDNQFDYNNARFVFAIDGETLLDREFVREGGKSFDFEFDRMWEPGEHELSIEVQPLTPEERQVRSLSFRVEQILVRGPLAEQHWVHPENYERFFPRETPADPDERRDYAQDLLHQFAVRAFRRPPTTKTVARLIDLAESIHTQPGKTFEAGIAEAMTAILASPRFLFREEADAPGAGEKTHPYIDEFSLASRLSYFFWSSMPDAELLRLAEEGNLRRNLHAQVARMLDDPRSEALIRNFTGQWLQARDIESVAIDSRAVLRRESRRDREAERRMERFRELRRIDEDELTAAEREELEEIRRMFSRSFRRGPRVNFDGRLRRSMRRETEMHFERVVREDRSLVELLDSDYAFLNEALADHYGIDGVEGEEMRRVTLPPHSLRGGILTQGTMLAVTSNPDRTSPVKRGVFILDNILGTPPAPPPPNIPALEDAVDGSRAREITVAETLAIHRDQPLCSSCHNRMDPLGLALENFNAMGMWRDQERQKPIMVNGKLISGESFESIGELKKILANDRRGDFYRCISEKLLTYALGRGLEYYDVHTVDTLVERLEAADGRSSALIMGIVESVPFQKRRKATAPIPASPSQSPPHPQPTDSHEPSSS